MSISLGLVANVYNEANALPGWIETHIGYFDDVRVLHAGPQGAYSEDGTLEILKKWSIPVEFCAIDEGFGVVRTKALRMSPCEWVMILDADERFYPVHQEMVCEGEATPQSEVDWILQSYDFRGTTLPNWENISRLGANLRVSHAETYNQGADLRKVITENEGIDAVVVVRRHWHDFSFRRPTQNWHSNPDWQMRILRNDPSIYFDPSMRMHERIIGTDRVYHDWTGFGPFFDHFHFTFKRQEQEQRKHDVAIYDSIHQGRKPPTWQEFKQ